MPRPPELRVGSKVVYDDQEHTVIELGGRHVVLEDQTGGVRAVQTKTLWSCESFQIVGHEALPTYGTLLPVDMLPADAAEQAEWRRQHVEEVRTGYRSGDPNRPLPGEPRPEYHPSLPKGERERNKVAELKALGVENISLSTLRRWENRWKAHGFAGLADGRSVKKPAPLATADPLIVDALRAQLAAENGSTGDLNRLRRRVRARVVAVAEQFGVDPPQLPPKRTFDSWVTDMGAGKRLALGAATTRETAANKPDGVYRRKTALRPGEIVEIDTTRLDIRVVDHLGNVTKAELTIAVDVRTRMIVARHIGLESTRGVNAALLLMQMLVPPDMRPAAEQRLRHSMSLVPFDRLVEFDARLADCASRGPIVPECVHIDNGRVYESKAFLDACRFFGVSVQHSRLGTPTDKAIVERTFRTINSGFCQHAAGATGGSVARRGRNVDADACWTVEALTEMFDEWVYLYHRTPHSGLQSPGPSGRKLTPIEAYELGIACAGYLMSPVGPDTFYRLLNVAETTVQSDGIQVKRLRYNHPVLNEWRGERGPLASGKFEVRWDPDDRSHVFWQHPQTGEWHDIPWVRLPDLFEPFTDVLTSNAVALADSRAGGKADQDQIAEALWELQDRLETGPGGRDAGVEAHRTSQADQRRLAVAAASGDDTLRPDFTVVDDDPEAEPVDDDLYDDLNDGGGWMERAAE